MAAENNNDSTDSTDKFELDGIDYQVPDFLDLEIGDWELVYDESGVVLADFAPADPKAKDYDADAEAKRLERMRNPRVERAFLMVAYLRAHPDATSDEAREVTRRAKLIPLIEKLNPAEDEAADPTLTTEQEKPSEKGSVTKAALSS